MSTFSLDTETWIGLGTMLGAAIATTFGLRYGKEKRKDTSERVVGLSIAGGIYDTGQSMLSQQIAGDLVKVGKEGVTALHDVADATNRLTDTIGHFDETTEREARNRTNDKLDQISEKLKDLDR